MIERGLSSILHRVGRRRGFLRDMLVNASGIAGGQALVLLATPVLARLYTPTQFGVYASLTLISGIVSAGGTLRLDAAMPSTLDDEMPAMYRLGLLAFGIVLCLALTAVAFDLHLLLPWPATLTGWLAGLCAATGALQGLLNIFHATLIRQGAFANTALLRVINPTGFIIAAMLMIPGGLPIAFAAGVIAATASGLAMSWRTPFIPTTVGLRRVIAKYWEFPVISLPLAMLDTFALAMPLLFIVEYYGAAAAGNYGQVQRLAAAPLILCAAAIAQVFYKHAGDAVRSGRSPRRLMWETVRGLGLLGLILLTLAVLVGEPVLALVLGKGWRIDTAYLLLLLTPIVARTVVSPITSIILLAGKVRLVAGWQALYAASTWLVLSHMSRHAPLEHTLLAVLLNEVCMYLIYLGIADMVARGFKRRPVQCAE